MSPEVKQSWNRIRWVLLILGGVLLLNWLFTPGFFRLVVKDGQVVLRKGFGMANLELGAPVSPDMVFEVGSVTKQFTAASILLLAEDGRLNLDDRVRKWLPSLPKAAEPVTIRHLLTHTSGLIDYEDVIPDTFKSQLHDADVLRLLESQD